MGRTTIQNHESDTSSAEKVTYHRSIDRTCQGKICLIAFGSIENITCLIYNGVFDIEKALAEVSVGITWRLIGAPRLRLPAAWVP